LTVLELVGKQALDSSEDLAAGVGGPLDDVERDVQAVRAVVPLESAQAFDPGGTGQLRTVHAVGLAAVHDFPGHHVLRASIGLPYDALQKSGFWMNRYDGWIG